MEKKINARGSNPRPLNSSDLPTINGFGVFIPKSVSGSGEAMFKHAYIGGMEALVWGRNLAWKFMVLEVVPPQWVRSHALACPHA